jgi:hypothetical protein
MSFYLAARLSSGEASRVKKLWPDWREVKRRAHFVPQIVARSRSGGGIFWLFWLIVEASSIRRRRPTICAPGNGNVRRNVHFLPGL